MKIVSFNIRCVDDKDGHSISERAPRLKAALDKHEADVIGFQEYVPKWEKYIADAFGNKYEIFNKYRSSDNFEGTPILWNRERIECKSKGYFWLSDTPEIESDGWDEYGCKRICIWAVFKEKATGTEFLYLNTHYGFGDECQLKSTKVITDFVARSGLDKIIITGDFNFETNSKAYKLMTKSFTDLNAVTTKDWSETFHGYYQPDVQAEHIDYCFISSAVKPISSKKINDVFSGKYPSDHYGLLSEIDW